MKSAAVIGPGRAVTQWVCSVFGTGGGFLPPGLEGICRFSTGGGHGESADGTDALPGLLGNREEGHRNTLPKVRGDRLAGGVSRAGGGALS